MSRKPKHASISAKAAIFEVLAGVKDGSYMTAAQISAMAKKLRNVEPTAVRSSLNSELRGVFEEIMVESNIRVRSFRPMARAYRWRDNNRFIETTKDQNLML